MSDPLSSLSSSGAFMCPLMLSVCLILALIIVVGTLK